VGYVQFYDHASRGGLAFERTLWATLGRSNRADICDGRVVTLPRSCAYFTLNRIFQSGFAIRKG
jgi:hypothetical protein